MERPLKNDGKAMKSHEKLWKSMGNPLEAGGSPTVFVDVREVTWACRGHAAWLKPHGALEVFGALLPAFATRFSAACATATGEQGYRDLQPAAWPKNDTQHDDDMNLTYLICNQVRGKRNLELLSKKGLQSLWSILIQDVTGPCLRGTPNALR